MYTEPAVPREREEFALERVAMKRVPTMFRTDFTEPNTGKLANGTPVRVSKAR